MTALAPNAAAFVALVEPCVSARGRKHVTMLAGLLRSLHTKAQATNVQVQAAGGAPAAAEPPAAGEEGQPAPPAASTAPAPGSPEAALAAAAGTLGAVQRRVEDLVMRHVSAAAALAGDAPPQQPQQPGAPAPQQPSIGGDAKVGCCAGGRGVHVRSLRGCPHGCRRGVKGRAAAREESGWRFEVAGEPCLVAVQVLASLCGSLALLEGIEDIASPHFFNVCAPGLCKASQGRRPGFTLPPRTASRAECTALTDHTLRHLAPRHA